MKNILKENKLFVVIVIALLFIIIRTITDPLKQSEEIIKNQILKKVPYGTSFVEVESYIQKKHWNITEINKKHGFFDQRNNANKTVGDKYIRVNMGEYRVILFVTNVTIFFGFDSQNKLIDAWVWKTTDGF